jgi:6-phosphogluconolactonase (cycloisomerase 2 family)
MAVRPHWIRFACAVSAATVAIWLAARSVAAAPPAASTVSTSAESLAPAAHEMHTGRFLYAVNQTAATGGSISVYDIGAGHRLVKTIETVRDVDDVRGVAASMATGRLYVAYRTRSGVGMIYCLNVYDDAVLWNRAIDPDVDRLAIHPGGQLLYAPTYEGRSADFINVLDASTGDVVRKVHFSNRSHDTLFPVSGPLFQETKAEDGSGKYLYTIDPQSYAVSRIGPYAGILGPYAVDGMSRYVVNNVTGLWGMQVAELNSGRIVTARLAEHPSGEPGLLHGIGWTPDQREVWQSSSAGDPHIYVWSMRDPMAPVLAGRVSMKSHLGAHWITFDIDGNYAYVAPNKSSDDATEIFDAHTHKSLGLIRSSEDMIEIDFTDGKVGRVGDQYGIGRVVRTSTN